VSGWSKYPGPCCAAVAVAVGVGLPVELNGPAWCAAGEAMHASHTSKLAREVLMWRRPMIGSTPHKSHWTPGCLLPRNRPVVGSSAWLAATPCGGVPAERVKVVGQNDGACMAQETHCNVKAFPASPIAYTMFRRSARWEASNGRRDTKHTNVLEQTQACVDR